MTLSFPAFTYGSLGGKIAGNGSLVIPIIPEAITSTSLTEYFLFDSAHTFTTSAGTTASVNAGDNVALVKEQAGRSGTITGGCLLDFDASCGKPGLSFDGVNNYMTRSYKGDVGTVVIIYNADSTGPHKARPYFETLLKYPNGYTLQLQVSGKVGSNGDSLRGHDDVVFSRARSDSTTSLSGVPIVRGVPDVLAMRTDGTNYLMNRSGVECASNQTPGTGTPSTLGSNYLSCLGGESDTSGNVQNKFKGLILGLVTFSGRVSDAEMPGLMQWAVNYAKQKQSLTGYVGAFFMGNSNQSETAAAHTLAMVNADSALTKMEYRPSNFPTVPYTYNSNPGMTNADWGCCFDQGTLWVTKDFEAGGKTIPLYSCTDGFSLKLVSLIDCSALSANPIAPSFVRNADNSMWKDANGLPALVFNESSGIYVVQPNSANWVNGEAWAAPTQLTGFASGQIIDPSCMVVGGTFYMFYSDYNASAGSIRYATSTSLNGTYTSSAFDPFGFGQGLEGPQILAQGGSNFALLIDADGAGYYAAFSTTGIAGAYSAPALIDCPFTPEHGELAPLSLAPNWPRTPALQSTVAPTGFAYPGKGLFLSGDTGAAATAAAGWTLSDYTSGQTPVTVTAHNTVADPNGNNTASTLNFPAMTGTNYASLSCGVVEYLPAVGQLGSHHAFDIYLKGAVGGEQLIMDYGAGTTSKTITLTTSWARYRFQFARPSGSGGQSMRLVTVPGAAAATVSACWPRLQ